jgi:hypothetical protein
MMKKRLLTEKRKPCRALEFEEVQRGEGERQRNLMIE